jgi:pimeloyl-ACP methyl ester carboxylesterase
MDGDPYARHAAIETRPFWHEAECAHVAAVADRGSHHYDAPDAYRDVLADSHCMRHHEATARISVPTLFLAADSDHLIPSVEQGTFMAARVPGESLRVLAGHGHACLIAPGIDLAEIIAEWERRRDTARR